MEIKAADVKALREQTGAGMMECKKALAEANGDPVAAAKILKEKGLAAVEKRADRATSEGRIFIKITDTKAAVCEMTCETDFVAKNADFVALGGKLLDTAIEKGYNSVNDELSGMLLELATKIRENMSLRRLEVFDIPADVAAASYVHTDGKTGTVVMIKADPASAKDNSAVKEFVYDCCLHMAAFTPAYIRSSDVDEAYLNEQKDIFTKQVESLDKPENVKAGIVQGKLKKHLADICFVDQPFVKDDKVSVAKKLEEIAKSVGAKLSFDKIILYRLGL